MNSGSLHNLRALIAVCGVLAMVSCSGPLDFALDARHGHAAAVGEVAAGAGVVLAAAAPAEVASECATHLAAIERNDRCGAPGPAAGPVVSRGFPPLRALVPRTPMATGAPPPLSPLQQAVSLLI